MISTDTLMAAWTALTPAEQLAQWQQFTQDLDAGEAAFHRFYLVLMPLWDRGDVPEAINERQLQKLHAEMAEEAAWELEHPPLADAWFDYCVAQADPSTAAALDHFEVPF